MVQNDRREKYKEELKEVAQDSWDGAKQTARDVKEDLQDKWQEAKGITKEGAHRVQKYAEENPWQMAAFGLVTGFILAALILRRRD